MGAANVIPGVSGGTMALLTGIFEKLINAIKSFDLQAIKLACTFKFKALFAHVDVTFLSAIGIGVIASILTFARVLEYLFESHALYVWSFFFGLILASVYFVGKAHEEIFLGEVADEDMIKRVDFTFHSYVFPLNIIKLTGGLAVLVALIV